MSAFCSMPFSYLELCKTKPSMMVSGRGTRDASWVTGQFDHLGMGGEFFPLYFSCVNKHSVYTVATVSGQNNSPL
jgi:hypothetical protein